MKKWKNILLLVVLAITALLYLYISQHKTTIEVKASVNATDYGVVCDGITDDTAAIQNALNSAQTVILPEGTCIISTSTPATFVLNFNADNALIGKGRNTVIKRSDASETGPSINIIDRQNITLSDFTLDSNNILGHGIRGGGNTNLIIDNLHINNVNGYGIGIEEGTNTNIRLSNITIDSCQDYDCIDFKNLNNDNSGITLDTIIVRNACYNTTANNQSAIDIRGVATLNNIQILDLQADCTGIRFREDSQSTGNGGKYSTLTNFYIQSAQDSKYGIYIPAPYVRVSNGTISGGEIGVMIGGVFNSISNVITENVTVGFYVEEFSKYTNLNGVTARTGDTGFIIKAKNVQLVGVQGNSQSQTGLNITSTARDTIVVGSTFGSNGGGVINNGVNTVRSGNIGF